MTVHPKHYKVVKGIGTSKYPLAAFDDALRNAGIGDYNLVKVSSIIPENCQKATEIDMPNGSILFAAYSTITIKSLDKQYAGVAIAVPTNQIDSGVIFECHSDTNPSEMLREMCQEAMKRRNKLDYLYEDCIQSIQGDNDKYYSAIAAVVLW